MLAVDMCEKALGFLGVVDNGADVVDVPDIDGRSQKGGDMSTFEFVHANDYQGAAQAVAHRQSTDLLKEDIVVREDVAVKENM